MVGMPNASTRNEALDEIWAQVPRADRYLISGKRYVAVWSRGGATLHALAEYAEQLNSEEW